ncbi:transposase family protein [Hamadaea sp. NPDC050747]|uniref:transposase family protein n=1 Tax=Hamadaea sp. NPDC050747 TaxID=3155789 RepID=UPI0033D92B9B
MRVENMTGLASDQVDHLVEQLTDGGVWRAHRHRALDPHRSVLVVLLYLRHNLPQRLLAELFGCSQPTISRLITMLIPILTDVLSPLAERVAERELRSTVRVDGFLAPIGDRRANTYTSGMYSGKRHRCGFNIQVVASWRGRLIMTGDPMPGAMHDARAWRESGLAARFAGRLHADGGPGGFADTAYTGTGLLVPERRTGQDLLGVHAREFNKLIASQRACVERCIAHLKNWRILATGYRRLTANFAATLAAITNLEIYRTSTFAS